MGDTANFGADDIPDAEPQPEPEPEPVYVEPPPIITFKPRGNEPMPQDDGALQYDFALEILKKQIRRAIQRGILDPRHLIARFVDFDDARFTKHKIQELVADVYREVITQVGAIEIEVEEVKFLLQNQLLIDELNDELERAIPLKEKVALVTALSGLSKDRINFLKFVGAFANAASCRVIQPARNDKPALPASGSTQTPSLTDLRQDADEFAHRHGV